MDDGLVGHVTITGKDLSASMVDSLVRSAKEQEATMATAGLQLGAIDNLVRELKSGMATVFATEGQTAESSA